MNLLLQRLISNISITDTEVHKTVYGHALNIHKILAENDIAVPILRAECINEKSDLWRVTTKKYDMTLAEYYEEISEDIDEEIIDEIKTKISEMHNLGIYHGDLHANNIVLSVAEDNTITDAFLIDFDRSDYIAYLLDDSHYINSVIDFMNMDLDYDVTEDNTQQAVNDLLAFERSAMGYFKS